MSSLDVGLNASSSMFYILFGRSTERFCLLCFIASLDVGLSALSSMYYVFFRSRTEDFVFNIFLI